MQRSTSWTIVGASCLGIAAVAWWIGRAGGEPDETLESRAQQHDEAPPKSPGLEPTAGRRAAPRPGSLSSEDLASAPFDGIVVDENGAPIGGAALRVTTGWGRERHVDLADYATAMSGADGRFVIPSKAWVEELFVHGTAAGRAPTVAQSPLYRTNENRVVLLTAAMVRVRVEDGTTHAPVAGARVYAFCGSDGGRQSLSPQETPAASAEGETDSLGVAALSTPGGTTQVLVRSEDHEPAVQSRMEVPPAGLDVTVSLSRGGTLEGRVIDVAKNPVPGARIVAIGPNAYFGRTTTGGDGSFALFHVPSNGPASRRELSPMDVAAIVSGYPRATARKIPCPSPPSKRSVEIVVRPWVKIQGTVRAPGGAPIPGASVEVTEDYLAGVIQEEMLGTRFQTTTGAAGAFSFREFSPEGGTLEATSGERKAYVWVKAEQVGQPVEILLGDAEAKAAPVVLAGTGSIGGRVVRVDGSPARVRVKLDRRTLAADGRESYASAGDPVATDAEGRFRVDRLADGDYLIYTTVSGLEFFDYPRYVKPGETSLQLIVMTPAEQVACNLEVEVIDADTDEPAHLGSAAVDLTPTVGGIGAALTVRLDYAAPGLLRSGRAVVPGTYDAVVHAHGYRDVAAAGIRVPDGRSAPRMKLRLEPASRVEGTVLDGDGRPVAGRVEVVHLRQRVTVGPDGRYVMGIASENAVLLRAEGDYIVSAERRDRESAGPGAKRHIDFIVKTGGAIHVRLKDGRKPERELTLSIATLNPTTGEPIREQSAGTYDRKMLDASGPELPLDAVVAGRYRITAFWDDAELPPREVEVRDRETTTVDIAAP